MHIEKENPDFKGCNDCIHCDDTEEICLLRRCVHAVYILKECYKPNKQAAKKYGDNKI